MIERVKRLKVVVSDLKTVYHTLAPLLQLKYHLQHRASPPTAQWPSAPPLRCTISLVELNAAGVMRLGAAGPTPRSCTVVAFCYRRWECESDVVDDERRTRTRSDPLSHVDPVTLDH